MSCHCFVLKATQFSNFVYYHQVSVLGICPKTKYSIDLLVMKMILSNKSIPNSAINGRKIKFPGFFPKSFQKMGEVSAPSSPSFLFSLLLLPPRPMNSKPSEYMGRGDLDVEV
mmetsp:Transcript_29/g.61  ORF Transcript_29/g.61 Transcript_29/m.61 type:complete len:113 (-) Transcript_29:321-659(-)